MLNSRCYSTVVDVDVAVRVSIVVLRYLGMTVRPVNIVIVVIGEVYIIVRVSAYSALPRHDDKAG